MAKQDLKEAGKILEKAREYQQFTLYETPKKKTKVTPIVVAISIVLLIAKYLQLI